jgi:hypothetical protein
MVSSENHAKSPNPTRQQKIPLKQEQIEKMGDTAHNLN